MENENKKYWFFGSKLNSVLLLILIILMIIALKWMHDNKEVYVPTVEQEKQTPTEQVMNRALIEGRKDDLISFSIWPGSEVSGVKSYRGTVKGAYFFEANIRVNVLGVNKQLLKAGNAVAKTDWMTDGPVDFEGNVDFTGLPKGSAYIEIHNDNPSDLPQNDKSILIPIVIK